MNCALMRGTGIKHIYDRPCFPDVYALFIQLLHFHPFGLLHPLLSRWLDYAIKQLYPSYSIWNLCLLFLLLPFLMPLSVLEFMSMLMLCKAELLEILSCYRLSISIVICFFESTAEMFKWLTSLTLYFMILMVSSWRYSLHIMSMYIWVCLCVCVYIYVLGTSTQMNYWILTYWTITSCLKCWSLFKYHVKFC